MRVPRQFGALEERPFRLLWIGRTTSALGDALIGVALAFAVIEVGGGAADLGLVLAALTSARVAFTLVGGVWADRLPRRFVMLACDVVRGAVDVFLAVALLTDRMELWMFYVTAALFGSAQAFFGPASTGLVPQTVSAPRLQQANALLSLSQSGTAVFGPTLSGLMIAVWSPGVVFAVDAVTFAFGAVSLAVLPIARLPRAPRNSFFADLGEGWRETWSHGWLRASLAAAAVTNLGIAALFVLGPLIARDELGGAAAWGAVLTGGAIGATLGGVIALRTRATRPLVGAFVGYSLGALPLLALTAPLPVLAVAVAYGVYQLGIVYGNALGETILQREIPPERLSRVDSFDWMVSICFLPIGQVVAGPLAEVVGRDATLTGAAALIAIACGAALVAPSVRAMRATPSPPPASGSGRESRDPALPDPLP